MVSNPLKSLPSNCLGEAKPGGLPLFSGKVRIVSRTLSGLFLAGAISRLKKRKRTNRENSPICLENPDKIGEVTKGLKKDKSGRTSPDREPPRLNPPV